MKRKKRFGCKRKAIPRALARMRKIKIDLHVK